MDPSAVDPIVWIILAVVVVAALVLLGVMLARKRRQRDETRQHLRERFGAEYDRTVSKARSRKAAEDELLAREQRRGSFSIRPVPAHNRDDLQSRWEDIQASFVDAPHASLRQADELIDEVANLRGYPDAAREQRLADLSVDHPAAVERYRATRSEDGSELSTEQLRAALLASRDLFETMLHRGEYGSEETPPTPFQELVVEDAPRTEDAPHTEDATHTGDAGTIDLTPHDRPREEVDTGGMPIFGPDGEPLPRDGR